MWQILLTGRYYINNLRMILTGRQKLYIIQAECTVFLNQKPHLDIISMD